MWSSTRVLQLVPPQGLPEVSGSRTRQMARGPSGELLDVPYFHVVFTVPSEIEVIAFQNQAVADDILFQAASETLRRSPQTESSGRGDRLPRRAAHLGTIPPTSPAHSFSRSWRWHRTHGDSWIACRPGFDRRSRRCCRCSEACSSALPDEGVRRLRAEILLRAPPPQMNSRGTPERDPCAGSEHRIGCLCGASLRRTRPRRLSNYVSGGRDVAPPLPQVEFLAVDGHGQGPVPIEGLPGMLPRQDDDP